jgi:polar amino acid transport system ATP-binding protein
MTKKFGREVILENVNAEIEKGEIITIIGPSGTGKSTFLRAVNMLEPPTSGDIFFDGEKLTKKNIDKARRKMGMVFQNFGLFSHLTVMQNVSLGQTHLLGKSNADADAESLEVLKKVGLSERVNFYPSQLSGGQKQRAAIARVLAMSPEVILFDEPTSSLDPTMVGEVTSVMRSLRDSGVTMLIVTHEMKFARDISSRILYMDERGIYEDGTPEDIFTMPKKQKTRDFINRTRSFVYEIKTPKFDFVEMLGGAENFAKGTGLDGKACRRATLIAEELILGLKLCEKPDCTLSVSYSETLDELSVTAQYPGESENPLTSGDEMSASIINNTAKTALHSYADGKNIIKCLL